MGTDLKTNLFINSPGGPRPELQLAHNLSLEFPDQITGDNELTFEIV